MSKVQELLEIISKPSHSQNYIAAMASNSCVICSKPAGEFRSALVKLEYECSGICQLCQDVYFSSGRNHGD